MSLAALRTRAKAHLAQPQHRNAYCLLLNNVLGAATGVVFWLLFARVLKLPPAEVGLGYAIVAVGTTIGVLAKGGLDTALLRSLPRTGTREAIRLFRFAVGFGAAMALALAIVAAAASSRLGFLLQDSALGWALVAAIGVFLVATWLQDARFLAEGDAVPSLKRNAVLSAVRVIAPVPVVVLALPRPVALSWALALGLSALAGWMIARRLPARPRTGAAPRHTAFLASSLRNATSGAAEFLPGLLLAPIVLAASGPEAAAYFGIAWTAASLLFLASSALSRSALAELVRNPDSAPLALRRAVAQNLALVLPGAVAVALLAPWLLGVFGPAYASEGAIVLVLLAASVLLVVPANLHIAVLRARDAAVPLTAYPVAMVAALILLAPPMVATWGIAGAAVAWIVANAPLGLAGIWTVTRGTGAPHPAAPTADPLPGDTT